MASLQGDLPTPDAQETIASRRQFVKTIAGAPAGSPRARLDRHPQARRAARSPSWRPPRARHRRAQPLGHADSGRNRQGHAVRGVHERGGARRPHPASSTRWGSTSRRSASTTSGGGTAKDQGLARAICSYHNETPSRNGTRMHPDRIVGMASIPLQFPDLAAEMLQEAVKRWRARRHRRRPRERREPVAAEVRSVLGQGGRDGRARVHASNGSAESPQGGRARRRRRPRQHRRQPARDDGLPVAADLRRHVRQVPRAEGAARTAAATCRPTWDERKSRARRPNQKCVIKKKPSEYMRSQILADTMVFQRGRPAAPRRRDGRGPSRLRHRHPVRVAGQCRLRHQPLDPHATPRRNRFWAAIS